MTWSERVSDSKSSQGFFKYSQLLPPILSTTQESPVSSYRDPCNDKQGQEWSSHSFDPTKHHVKSLVWSIQGDSNNASINRVALPRETFPCYAHGVEYPSERLRGLASSSAVPLLSTRLLPQATVAISSVERDQMFAKILAKYLPQVSRVPKRKFDASSTSASRGSIISRDGEIYSEKGSFISLPVPVTSGPISTSKVSRTTVHATDKLRVSTTCEWHQIHPVSLHLARCAAFSDFVPILPLEIPPVPLPSTVSSKHTASRLRSHTPRLSGKVSPVIIDAIMINSTPCNAISNTTQTMSTLSQTLDKVESIEHDSEVMSIIMVFTRFVF